MKHIIKQGLFGLVVFLCAGNLFSQSPDMNLKKYWLYRERLKNYIVVGNCSGCSNQAKERDGNSTLHYNDHTIGLGHYIGFLALEYKVLKDRGISTASTTNELYYALEAFNRLDRDAEAYWGGTANLNGFFIRDDVQNNFTNQIVNGQRVENLLNSSLVPPPDGYHANAVNSGWTDGMTRTAMDMHGPVEESMDQVLQIYLGLALVSKLVDGTEQAATAFADGEIRFVLEARRISQRILDHITADGRYIKNPAVGNQCVAGVVACSNRQCSMVGGCGSGNGADCATMLWGMQMANNFIQTGTAAFLPPDDIWLGFKYAAAPNGQDYKVLTLAAIGNVWGTETSDIITQRCPDEYVEHLPLVHQLLHGISTTYPASVYECMLNSAPCRGNIGSDGNYEWSGGERLLYGPNTQGNSYSSQWNGIDYMFYFDIYLLTHPSYVGAYSKINPKELALNNIFKDNLTEEDTKNFIASNEIKAGDIDNNAQNYTIQNDPQNPGGIYTTVSFTAGQKVTLLPGFKVTAGSQFNAKIDPAILPMNGASTSNAPCTICKTSGGEGQSAYPTYGTYKVYKFLPSEMFVATPHYLFKFSNMGGTGENMFGITQTAPYAGTHVIGFQHFSVAITDIEYANGYTFIGFADGSMLKINGTGGTGENMFAVNYVGSAQTAFEPVNWNYYSGDQKFSAAVNDILYTNGFLFVALENGKMLKVNGVGGSGHNMFAVTEIFSSPNAFNGISGYNYYFGDGNFSGPVRMVNYINGYLFVGFGNGKMLKVNGVGGSGHNMFSIVELSPSSPNAFDNLNDPCCYYYSGDQKFLSSPVYMKYHNGEMFVCLSDGKILKVSNVGGTGHNMFGVSENSNTFSNIMSPGYYIGDQKFSSTVTDIDFINDKMFVSFNSGRLLKVTGHAGTGHYLFNVDESADGFGVHDNASAVYLYGMSNFKVPITDFNYINGVTFLSLSNGKVMKLDGEGGSGINLFGLVDAACMKALCGSYYLIGCQNFGSIQATRSNTSGGNNNSSDPVVDFSKTNVYPNPSNGYMQFDYMLHAGQRGQFIISDILGQKVSSYSLVAGEEMLQINQSNLEDGVYVYQVIVNDEVVKTSKFVVAH